MRSDISINVIRVQTLNPSKYIKVQRTYEASSDEGHYILLSRGENARSLDAGAYERIHVRASVYVLAIARASLACPSLIASR